MLSPPAIASEWGQDLPAALQQARCESKLVLADFTGSTWCSACVQLRHHVLDAPEFVRYVADKFVPVEVDLPRPPSGNGAGASPQEQLAVRYNVCGFPSVLVLTSDNLLVGGFEAEVKTVKEAVAALEHACAAAEAFRVAAGQSGPDRARTLYSIYRNFPTGKTFAAARESLRAQILAEDPHNSTGIHTEQAAIEQARLFAQQRSNLPLVSPALAQVLHRQLALALPQNKTEVELALCQYALATAETTDDILEAKKLFEAVVAKLPQEQAKDMQHFVDTYFKEPSALLQMLNNSRPR